MPTLLLTLGIETSNACALRAWALLFPCTRVDNHIDIDPSGIITIYSTCIY